MFSRKRMEPGVRGYGGYFELRSFWAPRASATVWLHTLERVATSKRTSWLSAACDLLSVHWSTAWEPCSTLTAVAVSRVDLVAYSLTTGLRHLALPRLEAPGKAMKPPCRWKIHAQRQVLYKQGARPAQCLDTFRREPASPRPGRSFTSCLSSSEHTATCTCSVFFTWPRQARRASGRTLKTCPHSVLSP